MTSRRSVLVVTLALVAAFALQFQLYRANRWLDARLHGAPHPSYAAHHGEGRFERHGGRHEGRSRSEGRLERRGPHRGPIEGRQGGHPH